MQIIKANKDEKSGGWNWGWSTLQEIQKKIRGSDGCDVSLEDVDAMLTILDKNKSLVVDVRKS